MAKIASYYGDIVSEKNYYKKMEQCSTNFSLKLALCYVYSYIRENNFDSAREMLNKIYDKCDNFDQIQFQRLNAILGNKVKNKYRNFYSIKQVINYDKDSAIAHIMRHTNKLDVYEESGNFNDDVNIEELFSEIVLKISSLKPTYYDDFDHYIINYPNIGMYNQYETNYIEVITVPNMNNIITMYPILSDNIFAKNVVKKERQGEKVNKIVKRKSQIEKFYERYGKENR